MPGIPSNTVCFVLSPFKFFGGLNFYLLKINTYFKHKYYTISYYSSLNDFWVKYSVDTKEYSQNICKR